jgi:hypothetical protein
MNKGACDCCVDPFSALVGPNSSPIPILEQRYRDMSRIKCALWLNGAEFRSLVTELECEYILDGNDATFQVTQTQTDTEGSNYFNPEDTVGSDCSFQITYEPPESSWPDQCQGSGSFQIVSEPVGEGVYTDEELRDNVLSILSGASYIPSNEDFVENQPAQSFYVLDRSLEESSFVSGFATEAEYRISHRALPSCYLRVWIALMTYEWGPDLEFGALLENSNEIYTWEPTSNPCLPDPEKSISDDAQIIKSPVYSLAIPAETNTATFAFIRKYSFLPDYEPDDPIIVNPFSFSRPVPDCKPNGIPNPNSGC